MPAAVSNLPGQVVTKEARTFRDVSLLGMLLALLFINLLVGGTSRYPGLGFGFKTVCISQWSPTCHFLGCYDFVLYEAQLTLGDI
jgi:hypothetical protein